MRQIGHAIYGYIAALVFKHFEQSRSWTRQAGKRP
jgi:hypothetical protein